jgi:hypothetical protein
MIASQCRLGPTLSLCVHLRPSNSSGSATYRES